jgi:hypothetical protein
MPDSSQDIDPDETARLLEMFHLGQGRHDYLGRLKKLPPCEWHKRAQLDDVTPFGKLRIFLRAIADQQDYRLSYTQLAGDTGLHWFEIALFYRAVRAAGIPIEWRA